MLEEILLTVDSTTAVLYGVAAVFFTLALYLLLFATGEVRSGGMGKWKALGSTALVTLLVFAGLICVECAHAHRRPMVQRPPPMVPLPQPLHDN